VKSSENMTAPLEVDVGDVPLVGEAVGVGAGVELGVSVGVSAFTTASSLSKRHAS